MINFNIEEEPEWNYRVSETSAISSSSPLGEQTDASAKGKENQGFQICKVHHLFIHIV